MSKGWMMMLALLVACDGGDDSAGEGPICAALSEACHEADENGVKGAAECHDIAHEGYEDACDEALDECKKTCATM
jgi:hypothetical protein